MSGDLLQTKLYAPRLRPSLVPRPRLIKKLNAGLDGKLTLISAPAGFGKTTLVSEWIHHSSFIVHPLKVTWLSLDEADADPTRFLTYLVAALQKIAPAIGEGVLNVLQSPQTPPTESILTPLLNEIAIIPDELALILDDYHVIDAQPVDQILTFLLEHLPPQLHLVMTTREDPNLPLARLRVRGQLTELRAADLRFTVAETAVFLNQIMGLTLSEDDIAALEARTEGWIAGLQMAALSMQGQPDATDFIQSFTGSHRFVLDYLVEEVLNQQPERVQQFLLETAVLNQLTAPLCNALTSDDRGQDILEWLERANLFVVPLDNERRWYRYHHLFAELLRQRLQQNMAEADVAILHSRASRWYEEHGLTLHAFHHATAAHDVAQAARLIEGDGVPLYFQGEAIPVQQWLAALPRAEFEKRPSLWVTYASVLTMTGQLHDNIADILQAAETSLPDAAHDDQTADLLGQIAAIRAMLGVPKNQIDTIITQSRRALALLHPDNAPMRTTTTWALGYAYQVQGNREAASQAYAETIAHSQKSGNLMTEIAATTCLGQIQETENQLHPAQASFRRVLQLVGDPPWPAACEAFVGLGRIHYEWDDLETTEQYGRQALALARQLDNVDTPAACHVLLARVKLAQGDAAGALAVLAEADQFVQQHHFEHWVAEITAVRIQTLLRQGNLTEAAQLAETHDLPISQARVRLAQGNPAAALALLEPHRHQMAALVLLAVAYEADGERETAVSTLHHALTQAKPHGFIRTFIDAEPPMARLLYEAMKRQTHTDYIRQLLNAFPTTSPNFQAPIPSPQSPLIEPLSQREQEVLQHIAKGLTNQEIADRLYLSLHTVKIHARNIYGKLGVKNRTQAVTKGKALGILP
ncbi:MAG: LuxR family transcriptional regulator [Ardenticatenaceae bacterium]|nr:LuxR family transcriptional regulator [Ardenticatenaceae bacterium]